MSTVQQTSEERGQAAAKALSDFVNSACSHSRRAFVESLTRDHPTLQQGSARLFIACFERWAELNGVPGRCDLRNQATCELGAAIVANVPSNKRALPLI